jgi:hypothetical protein
VAKRAQSRTEIVVAQKALIRTKSINLARSEKCLLFCSYLFFNLSDESICSVVSDPAGREVRLKIDDFG